MAQLLTNASGGRDSPELVDDVPGQEVDVVVAEWNPGVTDAFTVEQVQLAVIQPHRTLKK